MIKKHFLLALLITCYTASYGQPWLRGLPQVSNEYRDPRPATLHDLKAAFDDYWSQYEVSEDETENAEKGGYQQFARYEYLMRYRTYPDGRRYDPTILLREYGRIRAETAHLKAAPVANWTYIGQDVNPSNNGGTGRINVIQTHPADPMIVFVGAACGGLWKSTDGGFTWSTTTDLLPSIAIADIAIDPQQPNTMYIATGDGYGYEVGGDFWGGIYTGGIFKSTDGGNTFSPTSLSFEQTNFQIFNRIIINPQNPNVLLTCSRNFIYRSADAGQTWIRVFSGRVYDLEFKPGDPNTVYAALGALIYKSTDGGQSWFSSAGLSGASGRMSIAVTPDNPDVIYALSASGDLWKSPDEGVTFNIKTSPAIFSTFYGYYDNVLEVSASDENVVLTGGVDIVRSNTGGNTWYDNNGQGSTGVHVDQKDFEFDPSSANTYIAANDGGIYKTYNGGNTWVNLGDDIKIKQYYRFSSSASNPSIYYAGSQDNGTDQFTGSFWRKVYGGDGMDCAVNPSNSNIAFVSSQYGNFRRTTDGGNNFSGVSPANQSGAWVTPIAIHPVNHSTVFVGYQDLFRSTNNGSNWTPISTNVFGNDDIDRIRISPSNPNFMYLSTLNSIKRSVDGGFTFTYAGTGLPLGGIALTDIAISTSDPDHVWVTFSGYTGHNKVFRTVDGGANWTNLTDNGLPNLPVNCIVYQPGSNDMVYVGTDIGMYYRDNSMPGWRPFNDGLPNVMVSDLEIITATGKIRAATYGRGLWESDLATSTFHTLDAGAVVFTGIASQYCDPQVIPSLEIQNFGSAAITSLDINYRVDAGPVQTHAWSGNLASLATTGVTLPQLTLTDGIHTLEAFVANPNGSTDQNALNDSASATLLVTGTSIAAPVTEGFENNFPPVDFRLDDAAGMLTQTSAAGGWGQSPSSMRVGFYDHPSGYAVMTSEPLDMTALSMPQLTFDVAYKRTTPPIRDSLIVEVSDDCGATWTKLYGKFGSALSTSSGYSYLPFVPSGTEWRNDVVSLTAYATATNLLVRFVFVSKYGNYLYLDNINLNDPLGINQADGLTADVFPVPASGFVNIRLSEPTRRPLVAQLTDLAGRIVYSRQLAPGIEFRLNLPARLSEGYYRLRLTDGNRQVLNRPLVIAGR